MAAKRRSRFWAGIEEGAVPPIRERRRISKVQAAAVDERDLVDRHLRGAQPGPESYASACPHKWDEWLKGMNVRRRAVRLGRLEIGDRRSKANGGDEASAREVNWPNRWYPSVSFAGRRGKQQQRGAPAVSTRRSIRPRVSPSLFNWGILFRLYAKSTIYLYSLAVPVLYCYNDLRRFGLPTARSILTGSGWPAWRRLVYYFDLGYAQSRRRK